MSGYKLLSDRVPYVPFPQRPVLKGPNGKRLLVWVIVNVEEWEPKDTMPRTVLTPPAVWYQGRGDTMHDYKDVESSFDGNEPQRFCANYGKAGLAFVDGGLDGAPLRRGGDLRAARRALRRLRGCRGAAGGAEGHSAVGFAQCNLVAHHGGTVFTGKGFQMAGLIKHHHAHGLVAFGLGVGESACNDFLSLFQGKS